MDDEKEVPAHERADHDRPKLTNKWVAILAHVVVGLGGSLRGPPLVELFSQSRVCAAPAYRPALEATMHGIIYLVGLIVVLLAVLSFFGLR